jgi:hypothetical protein
VTDGAAEVGAMLTNSSKTKIAKKDDRVVTIFMRFSSNDEGIEHY